MLLDSDGYPVCLEEYGPPDSAVSGIESWSNEPRVAVLVDSWEGLYKGRAPASSFAWLRTISWMSGWDLKIQIYIHRAFRLS
jgi:hypothetical protein